MALTRSYDPVVQDGLAMTTGHSVPTIIFALSSLPLLAACSPTYSPDTYSSSAVQHAEKVDQGVVVGVRVVAISADPTIGTATGGAAGGIAGSQIGQGTVSALGAVGGTVAGGIVGNVVAHATDDTAGYEYIVRKSNNDLLSVTQKDAQALAIGQHVLIIEGSQARIIPDYTVQVADAPHPVETPKPSASAKPDQSAAEPGPVAAPQPAVKAETPPAPAPQASGEPAPAPTPANPAKADAPQPQQAAPSTQAAAAPSGS